MGRSDEGAVTEDEAEVRFEFADDAAVLQAEYFAGCAAAVKAEDARGAEGGVGGLGFRNRHWKKYGGFFRGLLLG